MISHELACWLMPAICLTSSQPKHSSRKSQASASALLRSSKPMLELWLQAPEDQLTLIEDEQGGLRIWLLVQAAHDQ